jgi:hypothetical protein
MPPAASAALEKSALALARCCLPKIWKITSFAAEAMDILLALFAQTADISNPRH